MRVSVESDWGLKLTIDRIRKTILALSLGMLKVMHGRF